MVGGAQPAAERTIGGGVHDRDAATAAELGEVRGEVRTGSGGVVAQATGSGSGARRGTAGAEEPHTADSELRVSNIGLGVDSPRRVHPRRPCLPSHLRRPVFG